MDHRGATGIWAIASGYAIKARPGPAIYIYLYLCFSWYKIKARLEPVVDSHSIYTCISIFFQEYRLWIRNTGQVWVDKIGPLYLVNRLRACNKSNAQNYNSTQLYLGNHFWVHTKGKVRPCKRHSLCPTN
jgi:hypothetical protein